MYARDSRGSSGPGGTLDFVRGTEKDDERLEELVQENQIIWYIVYLGKLLYILVDSYKCLDLL